MKMNDSSDSRRATRHAVESAAAAPPNERERLHKLMLRLAEEMNCTEAVASLKPGIVTDAVRETPADAYPFGFFVGLASDSDGDGPEIPAMWDSARAQLLAFFEKFEVEPYDFGVFAVLTNTENTAREWAAKLDGTLVKQGLKEPADPGFRVGDLDKATWAVYCEFSHGDGDDDGEGDDDDQDAGDYY